MTQPSPAPSRARYGSASSASGTPSPPSAGSTNRCACSASRRTGSSTSPATAVSIDERRSFFRDNLYGDPLPGQDITQLWFPGVHSDVGGSYPREDSGPANTTLRWMLGELANNEAILCQDRINLVLGTATGQGQTSTSSTRPLPRPFTNSTTPSSGTWWICQFLPQQYYDKDDAQINLRVPFWTPRELPLGALVHSTAVERLDGLAIGEKPYKPRNLNRQWLHPLQPGQIKTSADLKDCYLYLPEDRHTPTAPPDFQAPAHRLCNVRRRNPRSGSALQVDRLPPPPDCLGGIMAFAPSLPLALRLLGLGRAPRLRMTELVGKSIPPPVN